MESVLTAYRRVHGLTQADIAARVGVKPAAVCKWEQKRVPAERVLAVSEATGIPPHRLRPDVYSEPDEGRAA